MLSGEPTRLASGHNSGCYWLELKNFEMEIIPKLSQVVICFDYLTSDWF